MLSSLDTPRRVRDGFGSSGRGEIDRQHIKLNLHPDIRKSWGLKGLFLPPGSPRKHCHPHGSIERAACLENAFPHSSGSTPSAGSLARICPKTIAIGGGPDISDGRGRPIFSA